MNEALVFADVETTGLTPGYHEIIQAAWRVMDWKGNRITDAGSLRALADHEDRIDPAAVKVNGYTRERWLELGAVSQAQLAGALAGVLEPYTNSVLLVGWGVAFDKAFLDALWERHQLRPPWEAGWRATVDVRSMAFPLFERGELPGLNLRKVAPVLLGDDQGHAHDASHDVDLTYRIFTQLLKR